MTVWLALDERYNAAIRELRRSLNEKLTTRTLKREEDPRDFFYDVNRWRTRLRQMGEIVLDYGYENVIVQSLPAEYAYVKNKRHRPLFRPG